MKFLSYLNGTPRKLEVIWSFPQFYNIICDISLYILFSGLMLIKIQLNVNEILILVGETNWRSCSLMLMLVKEDFVIFKSDLLMMFLMFSL